jgi:hypothetical protein
MKNDEDKEYIIDLMVNTIFIFNFQKNNNFINVRFGMQRFKDDMSGIPAKLTTIFIQSSRVFV